MKLLNVILILLPLLGFSQVREFKFDSEFEKEAFYNIDKEANTKNTLALFLGLDSNVNNDNFESFYTQLLNFNVTHKLNKNPRQLFDETQNHFFKHYHKNARLNQLIKDSIYNCVTGTAIMSFFLELSGFDYEIEEMPYHVFVTVTNKNKKYILETTDTQYGFLPDIKPNRRQYDADTIDNNNVFKEIGDYSLLQNGEIKVKGTVSFLELAGLNYYNSAIVYINEKEYQKAAYQLQKAHYLYPSIRIQESLKYSLLKILEDKSIDKKDKIPFYEILLKHTYSYSAN